DELDHLRVRGARGCLEAPCEKRHVAVPVSSRTNTEKCVVVLGTAGLEPRRNGEARFPRDRHLEEEQNEQERREATVSVGERVQCLELIVRHGGGDDGVERRTVVGPHPVDEVGQSRLEERAGGAGTKRARLIAGPPGSTSDLSPTTTWVSRNRPETSSRGPPLMSTP